MRMRRKSWARPELAAAAFFIDRPYDLRNHWREAFARPEQPIFVELGCGKGGFLAEMAFRHPEINFIGIDIKSEVLAVARRNISARFDPENRPVDNLLLMSQDIERLEFAFGEADVFERIYINFCNPWPKKAYWKHRLTHTRQLLQYKNWLRSGQEIRFKTDDDDLFAATQEYFPESGYQVIELFEQLPTDHPDDAIITEHEERFRAMGLPIHYIAARLPQTEE